MVIDTSALAAVLFGEKEAARYMAALEAVPRCFMSSFSWFETAVVVAARKGEAGIRKLHELSSEIGIEYIPFDKGQAEIAFDAWLRYGKGRHPAGLNIGDCAGYALARTTNKPLIYKGRDFQKTDIPPAPRLQL
jgi:ribonuclease VapC